eukprot:TRINITY_DN25814_c0_g1_i4.p1 TRINITY_DN25814_c0_g1~~TRINITY_DN25814_c0_g1_i4.p1  ORF type:complete len:166 (+),score=3.67 TRINITY_DN25814_c0_g1_i4:496-993(+)
MSLSGTWQSITTSSTSVVQSRTIPRRLFKSPIIVPWNSLGALTCTCMMGSNIYGRAAKYACLNAQSVASLKANSLLSTTCVLPSSITNLTPQTGCPIKCPELTASLKPFSIAGINSGGTLLPITPFTNKLLSSLSSGRGSMYPVIPANQPEPPLCFFVQVVKIGS